MARTTTKNPRSTNQNAARTVPLPDTTLSPPHLSIRDAFRLALFFIIPVYARLYLSSSVLAAFGHVYVVGCTGFSAVYFSGETVSVDAIWDIVYGLSIASFPSWGPSILQILWVGPAIEGWRWEVVYWAFVSRRLTYFLPDDYGRNVESLLQGYKDASPFLDLEYGIFTAIFIYDILWPQGCPWYDFVHLCGIVSAFVQYVHVAYLHYVIMRNSERALRRARWMFNTHQPQAGGTDWLPCHCDVCELEHKHIQRTYRVDAHFPLPKGRRRTM